MTKKQYGTWPSPITPKMIAAGLKLNDVQWDDDGQTLVWHEGRGKQGVLVAQTGLQASRDLTEPELSIRGGVGYGGGEFTVRHGQVYFVASGRVYCQSLSGGFAKPITPAFGAAASPSVSFDGRWVAYVHTYESVDGIALVDTDGHHWPRKLAFGTDFAMQPVWHPEGHMLAYIAWNHPQMPWDGTELRLVKLEIGADGVPYAKDIQVLAGDTDTAIFQPAFSPDGRYLAYISDESGFGQLYLYDLEKQTHRHLTKAKAEYGTPAWVQGLRTYGWTADGKAIYAIRNQNATHTLWRIEVSSGQEEQIKVLETYTSLGQIAVSPIGEQVALIASSSTQPTRIISYMPPEPPHPQHLSAPETEPLSINVLVEEGAEPVLVRRRSTTEALPEKQLVGAQPISWQGDDGDTVYGLYYPPLAGAYEGIGAPPLIVNIHGGPTSQRVRRYEAEAQFFATRGYAFLDVNYRGSTGYGRDYMLKLRGQWGVYDVEDAASGAQHLVKQGLADEKRLVIMGGSAGGYTVLQSLVEKPGFYRAGICRYGISNQFLLVQDTHKFEAYYNDTLLGPLPEAAEIYRARSPYFHADRIKDPLIIFQGEDDPVVPRNQSDSIVTSLRRRGVPHEYHVYEGEGHGWRKPETIEHYYKHVLRFLEQWVIYI